MYKLKKRAGISKLMHEEAVPSNEPRNSYRQTSQIYFSKEIIILWGGSTPNFTVYGGYSVVIKYEIAKNRMKIGQTKRKWRPVKNHKSLIFRGGGRAEIFGPKMGISALNKK